MSLSFCSCCVSKKILHHFLTTCLKEIKFTIVSGLLWVHPILNICIASIVSFVFPFHEMLHFHPIYWKSRFGSLISRKGRKGSHWKQLRREFDLTHTYQSCFVECNRALDTGTSCLLADPISREHCCPLLFCKSAFLGDLVLGIKGTRLANLEQFSLNFVI